VCSIGTICAATVCVSNLQANQGGVTVCCRFLPPGVFTTQCAREFGIALQSHAMVRIEEASMTVGGSAQPVLIVAKAELLAGSGEADPEAKHAEPTVKEEPAAKTPGAAVKSAAFTAATPANHPTPPSAGWCAPVHLSSPLCPAAMSLLPGSPTPVLSLPNALVRLDGVAPPPYTFRTPRSLLPCRAQKMGGSASKRPQQPISALNPYNNNWAVKAKVVNKGPKRRCVLGRFNSHAMLGQSRCCLAHFLLVPLSASCQPVPR